MRRYDIAIVFYFTIESAYLPFLKDILQSITLKAFAQCFYANSNPEVKKNNLGNLKALGLSHFFCRVG